VDIVGDTHSERVLFALPFWLSLRNGVLSNLSWQTFHQGSVLSIVDHKVKVTTFVVECDTLGTWEARTYLE